MEDIYDNVRFRNGDLQTYEKKYVKLKAESAYYVTETNKYYKTLSTKHEKEIDKKINEYVVRNYSKNSSS